MATAFGYAEVIALSQTGIQAAEQAFPESSACIVQASWFDAEGNPYTPSRVSYSLYDVTSGKNLLALTGLVASTVNTITVTAAQNAMVNASRESETHQALFEITDQNNSVFHATVEFSIFRVTGLS